MKYVIPLCLTCILKALGIVHNKLLCTEKTKHRLGGGGGDYGWIKAQSNW